MDIKKHGNVTVVHMPVRFDAQSSRDVDHVLQGIIKSSTKKVLCNFSHTDYISSAGLRVLLSASKELKKSDGQLYLCSTSPFVQEVLEISGLTTILKIFKTEKDALSDIG
jgi:anti-sigma B factor antagonist